MGLSEILYEIIKNKKTRVIGIILIIILILSSGYKIYLNYKQNSINTNNKGNQVYIQDSPGSNITITQTQNFDLSQKEQVKRPDIEITTFKEGRPNPPFYYVGDDAEIIYDIKNNIKVDYNVTIYWVYKNLIENIIIQRCFNEKIVTYDQSKELDKDRKKCYVDKDGDWVVYLVIGYKDLNNIQRFIPKYKEISVVKK